MGSDIHLYVEHRHDGRWRSVHRFVEEQYDGEPYLRCKDPWYTERNYHVFAILADVRNGYGFAGVPTGDGFVPISKPRGLPHDCDPRIRQLSDQWGDDGHSHSWLTLDEIVRYDWTQQTRLYGMINGPHWLKWNLWRRSAGLGPEFYVADVSGADIEHVSVSEMEQRIRDLRSRYPSDGVGWRKAFEQEVDQQLGKVYTRVVWEIPYYRAAGPLWTELVPRLFHLAHSQDVSYSDVRIVFWFDN